MAIEIYSIISYTVNGKQNLVWFKLHVQYIHVLSGLHVSSIYVILMQFGLHVQHIHVLSKVHFSLIHIILMQFRLHIQHILVFSKLCVGSMYYS